MDIWAPMRGMYVCWLVGCMVCVLVCMYVCMYVYQGVDALIGD